MATRLGVTQPQVSAYETGRRRPTTTQLDRFADAFDAALAIDFVAVPGEGVYAPASLAETAAALDLGRADPNRPIYEFLRGFHEASPFGRRALLVEPPAPTGDPRYDALLAGLAEHLAGRDHESIPGWTAHPDRFLQQAWYWIDIRRRRAALRAISPAAFARRLVFVDPSDLETV